MIDVAFKGASGWSLYFVAGDICAAENSFLMGSLKTAIQFVFTVSVGNHADVQRNMFHPDTLCNLNLSVLQQHFVKQQLFV